jgi:hypothetical protein
MPSGDADATSPRVLVVYYTYTRQSLKVAEVIADVMRGYWSINLRTVRKLGTKPADGLAGVGQCT